MSPLETIINEARNGLFELRQLQGEEVHHVPPARFYLPLIEQAHKLLKHAEEMALAEVPPKVKGEVDWQARATGPGARLELAAKHPEVRRKLAVELVANVVRWLVEDLQSEGQVREIVVPKLVRRRA